MPPIPPIPPPPGGIPSPPWFFRYFGHHGFGGDQESRNRGYILDRHANDLGRVDNTRRDQVDKFAGLRVEAVVVLILLEDLANDNGTVLARVDRDLAGRLGERRYIANRIPGARMVTLPGQNHVFVYEPEIIDRIAGEVEEFLTGSRREIETDRVLATVMFYRHRRIYKASSRAW